MYVCKRTQSARSEGELAEARHLEGASFHQLIVYKHRAMPSFVAVLAEARPSVSRCASRYALARPCCSGPRLTL